MSLEWASEHRALIRVIGERARCFEALALLLVSRLSGLSRTSASLKLTLLASKQSATLLKAIAFEPLEARFERLFTLNLLEWSESRAQLGGTIDALIIDLFDGLNPDALGATLGAVRGGGLVILLMPPTPPRDGALLEQLLVWPHRLEELTTRFWARWWALTLEVEGETLCPARLLSSELPLQEAERGAETLEPLSEPLSELLSELTALVSALLNGAPPPSDHAVLSALSPLCANQEQRAVLEAALTSQGRQAFTALSVTAHRGRGKSYALGLAAAALMLKGERALYVTAPSVEAVATLFEATQHALELAGLTPRDKAEGEGRLVESALGALRFVSPRALWAREVSFRALFVDEAAALPVPLLTQLLEGKPKLIFATTTYGYEGAGRGFSLRFRPLLQQRLRKLYERSLSAPIRWAEGDPVEAWSFESLALDASASMSKAPLEVSACRYEVINRAALSAQPERLKAIFGLLVSAHYRTQPSDLWRTLDAPNLSLHVLWHPELESEAPVAVALISEEGGLPADKAASLYEGRERPRGQLFAANFAVHLNCEAAASLKMARVVRVATRPQNQSEGLGSRLLSEVEVWARARGVALFGSSFGATAQLLRFWLREGFEPLRVSVRQSHMSGERSALVCKALTPEAEHLLSELKPELSREFEAHLQGALNQLELEVVTQVLASSSPLPDERGSLTRRDWLGLAASAYAGRAYELCERGARVLVCCALSAAPIASLDPASPELLTSQAKALGLSERAWRLMIHKSLQRQRWLALTSAYELSGPTVAMKDVSAALRALLSVYAPAWLMEEARRFPRFV